jgi:hypothetical protein
MLLAQVLLHRGRAFESAAAAAIWVELFSQFRKLFHPYCYSEWKESFVVELPDDSWLSCWATLLLAG